MIIDEYLAIKAGMPKNVVVPNEHGVRTIEFDQGFAMLMVMLNLSRQRTVDWLMETLYEHDYRGGRIFTDDGEELPIYSEAELRYCIGLHDGDEPQELEDRLFGRDLSRAWVTNVKKHAFKPLKRRPQKRCVPKYQFFYAAFVIAGLMHCKLDDIEKAKRLGLA